MGISGVESQRMIRVPFEGIWKFKTSTGIVESDAKKLRETIMSLPREDVIIKCGNEPPMHLVDFMTLLLEKKNNIYQGVYRSWYGVPSLVENYVELFGVQKLVDILPRLNNRRAMKVWKTLATIVYRCRDEPWAEPLVDRYPVAFFCNFSEDAHEHFYMLNGRYRKYSDSPDSQSMTSGYHVYEVVENNKNFLPTTGYVYEWGWSPMTVEHEDTIAYQCMAKLRLVNPHESVPNTIYYAYCMGLEVYMTRGWICDCNHNRIDARELVPGDLIYMSIGENITDTFYEDHDKNVECRIHPDESCWPEGDDSGSYSWEPRYPGWFRKIQ